jgi:hypothetical protein
MPIFLKIGGMCRPIAGRSRKRGGDRERGRGGDRERGRHRYVQTKASQ